MNEREWLAERFEEKRAHLRAVAYRMLGSAAEAEDAVQEAWLRLSRSGANGIENLGAWLTTVVARVSLDMLRSRKSKREESLDTHKVEPVAKTESRNDPEHEALMADSVGVALLVVLDRLTPAERLAFVLHDMFAVSFDEIAPMIGRSPVAARQLASRARRRVQGQGERPVGDVSQQTEIVTAFLTAVRAGDFDGLVAVLDPDVVIRIDEAAAVPGTPREIRGAQIWAKGAISFSRGARFAEPMLVDGTVGLIFAPRGRLLRVLQFTFEHGKIVEVNIVGDPTRLREFNLAVVEK
jgi:RNA polymerase sigma-70 factor (ECF subfamily)